MVMVASLDNIDPWLKACLARGLYLLISTSHVEFDLREMHELTRLANRFREEAGG